MRTVVIVLLARCAVAAVCVAQPTGVRERECAWESTFGSRLLCTMCPGLAPTLAGDGCSEFRWSQEAACTGHATWPQSTNGRGGVEAGAATGNEATIKVRRMFLAGGYVAVHTAAWTLSLVRSSSNSRALPLK